MVPTNSNIVVTKKDDVYLRIQAEPSIAQELHSYFCFDVPDARFHPLFRAKKWDGKLHLFSMFTKELYVGLLNYVKHFAEVNNYTLIDNSGTAANSSITIEIVKKFIDSLNLNLPNNESIREYQVEAVYQCILDKRRLLLSPTGSGKSLIIYCLIRWYELNNNKQLIIVPTTSLVEQLFSDFQFYSQKNGWKATYNVHRIYTGQEKTTDLPITISTWQSLHKFKKPYFTQFQVVYGDECHQFKAKSLTGIMNKCVNAPYKVGTTGTLDGLKTHRLVLEGLFGPVYKTTTTKKLIEAKQLSDLKIYAIVLKYPDDVCNANKKFKYQEEMDFLCGYSRRNTFIRNLALSQTRNTLVLFQFVEKHGKILYDLISSSSRDRKVFFVHGGTETHQREEIRKITEQEKNAIIIASYGTFSTGINIRNLYNIVFASPTKSRIRNLQSIGRGLRIGEEDVRCNLYDIGDDMSWKTKKNYTLEHMVERIKIYADEQFDYTLAKVNL